MAQIYQERFNIDDATRQKLVGAQQIHKASYPPLWDRGIFMCGTSEAHGALEIERIDAPFHVLLFTLSGEGELFEDARTWAAMPQTLALLPSGGQRGFRRNGTAPWHYVWFLLSAVARWQGLAQVHCSVHACDEGVTLQNAFTLFHAEAERFNQQDGSELALPALDMLSAVLNRALAPLQQKTGWPQALQALFAHIASRLHEDWPNERMAAQLQITPNHMHRLCIAHLGASPGKYLFQLRMQHARELLLHGQSVSQVAPAIAYREIASFSRQYSRHFGFNPSQTQQRFSRLSAPRD
ncbi:HTH-type transcriptional activator RhaS [Andreprevotia sp. IGB-42]|uniref:AraC family transcriptional regulator n=1 Tax=Andreprevotia sp. IGB-42 TaxID=2497473 RepID=UPI00135BE7CD|nr:AraC family transcriptional regulator [Andreprevotia sp. IGB-42]KAF0814977.1 HTH-type transcriptional activator RhaS [Andreprevotia sp. IGB-42]